MSKLNGYELRVQNTLDENGYVSLEHNQTYSIRLSNNNNTSCDAILTIDGKDMGGFRIAAFSSITIERPVNVDRKFTFYKLGTSEANTAQLTANNSLGLVSVVFKPEVYKPYQSIKPLYTREVTQGGGFFGAETTRPGAKGMSAGGTGLSEKSSQQFTEVANLNYDPTKETTIHLRLVCKEPTVIPLTAVTRQSSTSIPPSVL